MKYSFRIFYDYNSNSMKEIRLQVFRYRNKKLAMKYFRKLFIIFICYFDSRLLSIIISDYVICAIQ